MSIRTSLAKVRGLGSAKDGTHHWWMQRVTAIALMPLFIWAVFALLNVPLSDVPALNAWMKGPVKALLLGIFICVACYHGKLGMQVVIEDYVHRCFRKHVFLMINAFVFTLLAGMGVLAILKLHLM